jgi:hypothetical protein
MAWMTWVFHVGAAFGMFVSANDTGRADWSGDIAIRIEEIEVV